MVAIRQNVRAESMARPRHEQAVVWSCRGRPWWSPWRLLGLGYESVTKHHYCSECFRSSICTDY